MVTLGAYIGLVLASDFGLPFPVMVVLTLMLAALAGVVIERLLIRPIIAAPEFTLVIATFAIGLIIKAAIRVHWQDNVFSFDAPYTGAIALGPVRLNPAYLVIILATLVVVALLTLFFRNARFGKAMRAVALDQTAARLMGIGVGWCSLRRGRFRPRSAHWPACCWHPSSASLRKSATSFSRV